MSFASATSGVAGRGRPFGGREGLESQAKPKSGPVEEACDVTSRRHWRVAARMSRLTWFFGVHAMCLSSFSDVFSISHEREHEEHIQAGDLVRAGSNLFPHFEVIAVNGGKAWVRDVQTGADHLALLSRCRKVLREPLALAA